MEYLAIVHIQATAEVNYSYCYTSFKQAHHLYPQIKIIEI